jgi:hypothetical protein
MRLPDARVGVRLPVLIDQCTSANAAGVSRTVVTGWIRHAQRVAASLDWPCARP